MCEREKERFSAKGTWFTGLFITLLPVNGCSLDVCYIFNDFYQLGQNVLGAKGTKKSRNRYLLEG